MRSSTPHRCFITGNQHETLLIITCVGFILLSRAYHAFLISTFTLQADEAGVSHFLQKTQLHQ